MDKSICNVIATGSTGNAVLYHNSILVDCGVPYKEIEPYIRDIQIVIPCHIHNDHINHATLKRIIFERPGIRVAAGQWMVESLDYVKNLDVLEICELYDYGAFKISPVKAYHDVPNMGLRIFKGDYKIFHITDTATLQGIEAKGYDLFSVEHNYNADEIEKAIAKKTAVGEYCKEIRAVNTHLSEQQAREFIYKNRKESSIVVRLHESSSQL